MVDHFGKLIRTFPYSIFIFCYNRIESKKIIFRFYKIFLRWNSTDFYLYRNDFLKGKGKLQ